MIAACGLSPRVRGNHSGPRALGDDRGSIPARAGEPSLPQSLNRAGKVYPRACGGTELEIYADIDTTGLSPRVRGTARTLIIWLYGGLSPRVRGNLVAGADVVDGGGSIPARAGEPSPLCRGMAPVTVYPRACGGTSQAGSRSGSRCGLSPRVRGNRLEPVLPRRWRGSIPARAGEPLPNGPLPLAMRVYPRACGGTSVRIGPPSGPGGLSPRVRGNHPGVLGENVSLRSIPARAGEPGSAQQKTPANAVYPRACGGTGHHPVRHAFAGGLSPRVRGNRVLGAAPGPRGGSIPARAGEPRPGWPLATPTRVYPRACGGTEGDGVGHNYTTGLSPRVRGNPTYASSDNIIRGSIPARAGEPRCPGPTGCSPRVYPRACGGTRRPGRTARR